MFLQLSPLALFLPLFSIADLKERRIPNRLLLLALLPGMAAQNPHFLLRLCPSLLSLVPPASHRRGRCQASRSLLRLSGALRLSRFLFSEPPRRHPAGALAAARRTAL